MKTLKAPILFSAAMLAMILTSCGSADIVPASSSSRAADSSMDSASSEANSSIDGDSSTAQESSSLPEITNHQVRRVPVYETFFDANPTTYFEVHHFNGSSVGYLDLKFLFDNVVQATLAAYQITTYSLSQEGTAFTIANGLGSAIFDFLEQSITYVNYDGYNIYHTGDYLPYHNLSQGGEAYFVTSKSHSKYENYPSVRTISLPNYHIPMYYVDGSGYLPLDILDSYLVPVFAGLFKFTYTGAAIYGGDITSGHDIESVQKEAKYYGIYDEDYMEYTYNLLALNLDSFYGLDKKISLVDPSKTKTFMEDGAYAAIAPYHDKLVSLDTNVANGALIDVIMNLLDDGGHSGYQGANLLCDKNYRSDEFYHPGEMIQYRWNLTDQMKTAREKAGLDITNVVKNQTTGVEVKQATQCYYEEDGVAYFCFDSFDSANGQKPTIDINNYWYNTIYAVHYANEQLRREGAPKNLVIDLSCNGGGSASAEEFIGSWLCNGVTTVLRGTKDKTFGMETVYADVNFDGVYSEEDYLPEDVNVYCIIDQVSFSCGNLLPWQLKEQRETTRFIGDRTGGGSCVVKSSLPSGLGSFYQISGPSQLGSVTSTDYDHFVSLEDGVAADWHILLTSDEDNIAQYYDHSTLNKLILAA